MALREHILSRIAYCRKNNMKVDLNAIRLLSIKNNKILIGPEKIQINITSKCNYNCKFCLTHSPYKKNGERINTSCFISLDTIKRIAEQAYSLGTEIIYICGEGEPLLHPKIIVILKIFAKYKFKILILTNALCHQAIAKILKLSPSLNLSFAVNLSAATSKQYSDIHGRKPSDFKYLLENIRNLNRKFSVLLSFLIFKDSYKNLLQFINLAKSLRIKSIILKFPTVYDTKQKSMLLGKNERRTFLEELKKILSYSKRLGIHVDSQKYIIEELLQKNSKMTASKCFNGWFFLKIKMNGDLFICCRENRSLGNAKNGNFKDKLFSSSFLSYLLEGKNGINLGSKNWKKCMPCLESKRNCQIENL